MRKICCRHAERSHEPPPHLGNRHTCQELTVIGYNSILTQAEVCDLQTSFQRLGRESKVLKQSKHEKNTRNRWKEYWNAGEYIYTGGGETRGTGVAH